MDGSKIIPALAVAALSISLLGASPAYADDDPGLVQPNNNAPQSDVVVTPNAVGPIVDVYQVVNKTSTTGYVNYAQKLTYCQSGTAGVSCTISSTYSATRTIGVSLGWTRAGVAAGLSISSASSVSVSVACTSPPLAAGQKFVAYPIGTRYSYRIYHYGTYITPTYSGYLTAFNPNGAIYCRVE